MVCACSVPFRPYMTQSSVWLRASCCLATDTHSPTTIEAGFSQPESAGQGHGSQQRAADSSGSGGSTLTRALTKTTLTATEHTWTCHSSWLPREHSTGQTFSASHPVLSAKNSYSLLEPLSQCFFFSDVQSSKELKSCLAETVWKGRRATLQVRQGRAVWWDRKENRDLVLCEISWLLTCGNYIPLLKWVIKSINNNLAQTCFCLSSHRELRNIPAKYG